MQIEIDEAALVLSPHVDDEVLGCFSFLNAKCHVVFGGIEDRPSFAQRKAELDASSEALGFTFEELGQPVNAYEPTALIPLFESIIAERRPATVLLPAPSYNQDHRAFHEAAMIAVRPHDQNHRVNTVLVYEQPHSVMWPLDTEPFQPSVFVSIDAEAKLVAYERYQSQVRGHRSSNTVRALAELRGAHIGEPAAEAFELRRLVATSSSSEGRH